ncbi:MAG: DUF4301 family protein [Muribaculaceae bacterium]|nr:DUF4301 family protein [Muribaculaceae bacterium]
MFTEKDLELLKIKGVEPEQIEAQLARFKTGFPWLRVESVATVGRGIARLTPKDENHYIKTWNHYRQSGGSIEKLVPASGAASRMFKNLFAFADSQRREPETDFEKTFFEGLHSFAFFPLLNKACVRLYQLNASELLQAGRHVDVVKALLGDAGLNYGTLPKALLKFHRAAAGSVHTPVEEHLEEAAQYAADAHRVARLHFTVSPEHRRAFERLLAEKVRHLEQVWGVTYQITLSEQLPSTDTIAVTADNEPFRDTDGRLVFRPAGHGALIENLNDREAAVVFIKNIDNVVPQAQRGVTTRYKKVLAGVLVESQYRMARMLNELDNATPTRKRLTEMLAWVEHALCTHSAATADMDDEALAAYLRTKLNRPLRVCGMVRNQGEPGGGPYLAYNADGSCSPQILEAAQIDADNPEAVALMASGTHFNPVDLVCYIRDYKGEKFNLKQFVDPDTGLISEKSVAGVPIRALELPGLWNGSMSDWCTIFVEVPIETFNPVKTVNDLLRPEHAG